MTYTSLQALHDSADSLKWNVPTALPSITTAPIQPVRFLKLTDGGTCSYKQTSHLLLAKVS